MLKTSEDKLYVYEQRSDGEGSLESLKVCRVRKLRETTAMLFYPIYHLVFSYFA